MYRVELYSDKYYKEWNDFVTGSKNGTFLFHREFMEYHKDRFEDFSLLVFNDKKLVALLPANRVGDTVYSHQGLTYGGLVTTNKIGYDRVKMMLQDVVDFLKSFGIVRLELKVIPSIYHRTPANECEMYLLESGAEIIKSYLTLAIPYNLSFAVHPSKLKNYRKLSDSKFETLNDNDFDTFWNRVLEPRLALKHNTKPVHTLSEIKLLHDKFPDNIKQYNIYHEGEILAGLTLFINEGVVKSQYGATTDKGEHLRALDYLFITLINDFKNDYDFFDMGTVNDGEGFNSGLLKQKEELGCSLFIQNCYSLNL